MGVFADLTRAVGNTPLVKLNRIASGIEAAVFAKMESFNPLGCVKDRIAVSMIDDAQRRGVLNKDSVIIEPTSGNTGIGLAFVSAARGYRLILVMPDTMSMERRQLQAFFGAELVLTPGADGMPGAIKKAQELVTSTAHAVMLDQFSNPANPDIHRRTTGPEIWKDTSGKIDIFIAGVGTGGTITGVGEFLKMKKKSVRIVAVEPDGSPVLSGGKPGTHRIQGIGAGFIPAVLNRSIIDEVMRVKDEDAGNTARQLARLEGMLAGISGGAAAWAALEIARRKENRGKTIVFILPDTGERYLSTWLFK
jgi:cysteine synthase